MPTLTENPMKKTFICVASGPSLNAADCAVASKSGHPVIAVNSSWVAVPDCEHIFAADYGWWRNYHRVVPKTAFCWTQSKRALSLFDVNLFSSRGGSFNSGQRAIELAAYLGAERVILLGYDCTLTNGTHWHGDHPVNLRNPTPGEVGRWHTDFSSLVSVLPDVEIINASRHTTLTCFPRLTLEAALNA